MKQNICRGYFAFDRTQMVEGVTWQAQCKTCWCFRVMAQPILYATCTKSH